MTSSLFTGIRSSLSLTFPISTPPPSGCLSNHIDAVELVTRLVMSKAHLTTCFPYGGDLTHVTECFELKSPHFSLGIRLSFYWLCFRQCQLIWIVRDCCKGIKSQDQHHIIELLIVLHVKQTNVATKLWWCFRNKISLTLVAQNEAQIHSTRSTIIYRHVSSGMKK